MPPRQLGVGGMDSRQRLRGVCAGVREWSVAARLLMDNGPSSTLGRSRPDAYLLMARTFPRRHSRPSTKSSSDPRGVVHRAIQPKLHLAPAA